MSSGKVLDGSTIAFLLSERACKDGVAYSQLSLGHWTPKMYSERCKEIDTEFRAKIGLMEGAQ